MPPSRQTLILAGRPWRPGHSDEPSWEVLKSSMRPGQALRLVGTALHHDAKTLAEWETRSRNSDAAWRAGLMKPPDLAPPPAHPGVPTDPWQTPPHDPWSVNHGPTRVPEVRKEQPRLTPEGGSRKASEGLKEFNGKHGSRRTLSVSDGQPGVNLPRTPATGKTTESEKTSHRCATHE